MVVTGLVLAVERREYVDKSKAQRVAGTVKLAEETLGEVISVETSDYQRVAHLEKSQRWSATVLRHDYVPAIRRCRFILADQAATEGTPES